MAESKEELESLDEGERGEWKIWLKTQHSKNWDHVIWSLLFLANGWGEVGTLVPLLVWVYLSSSPAWFILVSLSVPVEELSISLLVEVSHLQQQCLPIFAKKASFCRWHLKTTCAALSDTKTLFQMKSKARVPQSSPKLCGSQKKPPFLWFHW